MARRKIGPAYEKAPSKRVGDWFKQVLPVAITSLVVATIFWFGLDWSVDYLFNFLATSGDESIEKPFCSNDDIWILLKLVGSLGTMVVVAKMQTK